jgi:hypothetical protein
VIRGDLPVNSNHERVLLLVGLALVAKQAQQVLWASLAVSVPAASLCMCLGRDGQLAQRASRGVQSHLASKKPVWRVLTDDPRRQPGFAADIPRAGSS